MEELANTIESQVIHLSCLDSLVLAGNMQYVNIYENEDGSDDFMPFDALKRSFYKALQYFPVLVGRIKEVGKNKFDVVVDKDDLNMPEYLELTCDIHYSELKEVGFSWEKWPKNTIMPHIIDVDAAGSVKNVKIQVIRLRDNSGMIISPSVAHCLVDGIGYFEFVNLWADICKQMRKGRTDFSSFTSPWTFSRSVLTEKLPEQHKPLDADTHWMFTFSNVVTKCVSRISWSTLARLCARGSKLVSTKAHMFRISRESLDRIHESMREFTGSDICLSDCDVICALLSKTLAQSEQAAGYKNSILKIASSVLKLPLALIGGRKERNTLVGILFSARPCLGIANECFVGNAAICSFWKYTAAELTTPTTPESLATTAMRFSKQHAMADSSYVAGLLDLIDKSRSFNTQAIGCAMHYSTISIINHLALRMYNADFGDGIQTWASFAPGLKFTTAKLLPCPPGISGISVYFEAADSIMESVLTNESWRGVAELIY